MAGRTELTRDSAAVDFGHLVSRVPRGVVRPQNLDELVTAVAHARRDGVRLVARGQGHSTFGQCQVVDGLVLDMGAMAAVQVQGDTAIVEAGATWRDVARATLAHGLLPPISTDYVGLSVGGTLSVGGIGASSFRYGAQTDQVRALTAVTGTGAVLRCSPEQNTDLFDTVRGGLGHVAILAQAELPLVPSPAHVRHFRLHYLEAGQMLRDLERLVTDGQFDQLSAVGLIDDAANWAFHIDAVSAPNIPEAELLGRVNPSGPVDITTFSAFEYITRLDAVVEAWHTSGLWSAPHPWCDVFIPAAELPAFMEHTLTDLGPEDLGTEGAMLLIYPISNTSTPLLPLATPSGYLFDVLRCNPGADAHRIEALLVDNRRIYEDALRVNGTLYPISAVRMTSSDWQQHFGAAWSQLIDAKRQYDPAGILGCGWLFDDP